MPTEILPLFPLGSVLYPRMPMRLHIFEPRYQALVSDCGQGGRFGVAAIREGSEVGPPAVPHEIGTVATVERLSPLPRGRSNILVVGRQRFRIRRMVPGRPYLQAEVELLEGGPGEGGSSVLARRAAAGFCQYLRRLSRVSAQSQRDPRLPDDPELLSWTIAAGLLVEPARKQALLAEGAVDARLRQEIALLQREVTLLDLQLANQMSATPGYSLN